MTETADILTSFKARRLRQLPTQGMTTGIRLNGINFFVSVLNLADEAWTRVQREDLSILCHLEGNIPPDDAAQTACLEYLPREARS